MELSESMW